MFLRVRNLPMRSWNLGKSKNSLTIPFCSQFTNEELKQRIISFSLQLTTGSQFTNEELKHDVIFFKFFFYYMFAIYQWGVETRHSDSFNNSLIAFAIYQWGVETWAISLRPHNSPKVRNLPMRSWNAGVG